MNWTLDSTTKQTNNKYLNLYDLAYTIDGTKTANYYLASRREASDLSANSHIHDKCDAVEILPIYNDEVIMIKQFRPAINGYAYEFPAGLVDEGEDIFTASKRELQEEIGAEVNSIEILMPPQYSSVGLTDECTAITIANVVRLHSQNLQDNEDIEVVHLKKNEIMEFIKDKNIAAKAYLVLLYYANI